MARQYKYFYSADVLTVVSAGDLQPVKPSNINSSIDDFERKILNSLDNNDEFNVVGSKGKQEEIDSFFDIEKGEKATPNPRPLPPDPFGPDKGVKYGQAWIYGGCKFEITFLMNDYRYRDLGLLRDEDLQPLKGKVTKRRFRTFDSAASLEIFSEASFTIKPDDEKKTADPWGASYTSYVPYAGRYQFAQVRSIIEGWTFNFGTPQAPIKYSVEVGSVKLRRLRKYNPI
jgi:hypothetical protein